ncbi:MAG TPA: flagellar biosynthetic protein FliR [Deltaproteobacteria bacterium]|nr:flagellar biosynthetic protein FliR [Deltaproteobacteria bacterium]
MNIYIETQQMIAFLFLLIRVSIVLFMVPFFSDLTIPPVVKGLLCIAFTFCLFQLVPTSASAKVTHNLVSIVVAILGEVTLGIFWGLITRLVLAIFQISGEFIGYHFGFSIANILDPQSGVQLSILSQWFYLIAMLVFFAVNAHYIVINALVKSLTLLPPGSFIVNATTFNGVRLLSYKMFVIALQISAPVVAVLLFTQVAMGIIAKTVPQINILISSFPLTIFLGFLFLGLTIELLGPRMGKIILSIHKYFNLVFVH